MSQDRRRALMDVQDVTDMQKVLKDVQDLQTMI